MKKGLLIFGIILLISNILIGLIVSSYETFNVCLTSVVIIATTFLLEWLSSSNLKDAFKISLTVLFSFLGLVEFVLGLIAPAQFKNNWYLVVIIVLIIIESLFVISSSLASKH